jgi:hypothetical protein
MRHGPPSPAEIDQMDRLLPLIYRLENRLRAAAMLRAIPLSFRKVGDALGVSRQTAREYEERSVDQLARFLVEAGWIG